LNNLPEFFLEYTSVWAGFRARFLETGSLSPYRAIFDPRGFP